jgi:integrase
MGSIYRRKWKDKDGIIREGEILWIKYYRNGKPIRESTGSTKDADAKRLLKKREGEISQGKLPGIYFDRVRFDELAEGYLADYKINDKNVRDAKRYVRHLEPFFGGMRVTSITTDKIKHYINKRLDADAANGTINRELSALRRMLNLGAQQTPPKVDKVPFIPMLKENNVRKGFFEHDEFLAVRTQLPEHLQGIATFGYKTGWRRSEITGLTWKQVDLKQGIVRLEPGMSKNKEARTVYLDDELKEMFKTLWENRKSALPYVFLNQSGTDRVKTFDKAWGTACKKAGIGVKLFHDLRRTAVRNMVRSGTPERVAMMISGHKTRSVFDRYNIVDNTDLKLAAQRQAEYLESKMGTNSGTIRKVISVNPARP